jgi:ABC-type microcin C transport system permease subunit YejB
MAGAATGKAARPYAGEDHDQHLARPERGARPTTLRSIEETYGQAEPVQDLIPAMLASFLEGDKAFARRRRGQSG